MVPSPLQGTSHKMRSNRYYLNYGNYNIYLEQHYGYTLSSALLTFRMFSCLLLRLYKWGHLVASHRVHSTFGAWKRFSRVGNVCVALTKSFSLPIITPWGIVILLILLVAPLYSIFTSYIVYIADFYFITLCVSETIVRYTYGATEYKLSYFDFVSLLFWNRVSFI